MFQLNNKIASLVMDSLTLEELEAMVRRRYDPGSCSEWEAYEFLKGEMGLKDNLFSEDEFRGRHSKILTALDMIGFSI